TVDGLELELPPRVDARADDLAVDESIAPVIDGLGANADRLARRATRVSAPDWARTATIDGESVSAEAVLAHAVHDATHHLMDVGRGLHDLGAGPARAAGTVARLNVSNGGVPKRGVPAGTVGKRGIGGDRQAT